MSKVFFGFDTSNYATSFAVCDEDGNILRADRRMLGVKPGERGLRQSDAVFQHTVNSEFLAHEIEKYSSCDLAGVGYSARPRDIEGSYMPCFLVGKSIASAVAASRGAALHAFSHQAGHIAAALYGADASELLGERFIAFHVSGGTTDVLLVDSKSCGKISAEVIGGSRDLHAGQIIDRAGVEMGMAFPAGKFVEEEALKNEQKVPSYPCKTDGFFCNLSGVENKFRELYKKTDDKALASAFVIKAVADTLFKITNNLREVYPSLPIVYSGGVMSCEAIKRRLSGDNTYFASPAFSSDNAAGIAYLTMLRYKYPEE